MENDEVVESKPTETMESDDDFFSDVDEEVIKNETDETDEDTEEESKSSDEETNEESEPNGTQEDNSKEDEDFKPLLDKLSKEIKYNKEPVQIDSLEDLITNYQKGLNYDKKVQELEDLQNSKLEKYAKTKADELGISVEEYMNRVEQYEKDQQEAKEAEELDEMVENGVPNELAKEILAGRQLRLEYQQLKNELRDWKESTKAEEEKNKEYEEFLDKFPEVNPEDIPKEVFEDAQNSSLTEAYMKWKLDDYKKQLKVAKTNEKNYGASIGSVTDTGKTEETHKKDPFLEGFEE